MKNIFVASLLFAGLFTSQQANAQNAEFTAGDRSVAIIANPVFSYLGNMFNQDIYNDLYLSSTGIVFRKFTSATRANRFQFDLSVNNSMYDFPGLEQARRTSSMFYSLNYGKEYRKSFTNLCVYGGWMAGASISARKETYSYSNPPENGSIRQIEMNYGTRVGMAGTGFLGTEYYFSPNFFIGAEVRLRSYFGYKFDESSTTEYYSVSGNVLAKSTEITEVDDSFSFSIDSDNPVLFFVGIKF